MESADKPCEQVRAGVVMTDGVARWASLPVITWDLTRRLPSVSSGGLPANAVTEVVTMVRSAIDAEGWPFPRQRVNVDVGLTSGPQQPGARLVSANAMMLPIALAILGADGTALGPLGTEGLVCAGELDLIGRLRPVRGAYALAVLAAKNQWRIVLPQANADDVRGCENVYLADTLADVVEFLRAVRELPRPAPYTAPEPLYTVDMADVWGQPEAKRALEIAAAGGHHLLFMGPPGCSKTMLARRLPGILPEMPVDVTADVRGRAGLWGLPAPSGRPFRAPHHSITLAGLHSEFELARHGVLLVDESHEFARVTLESLPFTALESLPRTHPKALRPLCVFASSAQDVELAPNTRRILPRSVGRHVDLRLAVRPAAWPATWGRARDADDDPPREETSAEIRARVTAAQAFRDARGDADSRPEWAAEHNNLTMREQRTWRVARTIADLAASIEVRPEHYAEAWKFTASAPGECDE